MLWNLYIFILRDEKFLHFTWIIQEVFIPREPCRFQRREWLKFPLFFTILMRDKYLLYIINEIISLINPLRDFIYTYEYKYNDLLYLLYFYYRESFTIRHIILKLEYHQVFWIYFCWIYVILILANYQT
jgi:cellulose synthase/poly-beta-1,6-N-acetylglucosamine synthase-like glycosyltransferase